MAATKAAPKAAPAARPSWALRLVRNALLWLIPVALLWLLVTPVSPKTATPEDVPFWRRNRREIQFLILFSSCWAAASP